MIRPWRLLVPLGAVGALGVGFAYQKKPQPLPCSVRRISKHSPFLTHSATLPSNDPCEDQMLLVQIGPTSHLLAVFDGHSGKECAESLVQWLPHYISEAMRHIKNDHPTLVKQALVSAFENLDRDLLMGKLSDSPHILERFRSAVSGACALVAYIQDNRDLYVAWAGDCRAVLGRKRMDGSFETIPLSRDHTPKNPQEQSRLLHEHPGEMGTVIHRNRVLGSLMPSRAFGDARYKWTQDIGNLILPYFNRRMPAASITPPYVTASPEVTHVSIPPKSLLVLATDGLYDELQSEDVIQLASDYLDFNSSKLEDGTSILRNPLDNAAEHLIRNALAHGSQENLDHVLQIKAPYSRKVRDDMTCHVVFLDPEFVENAELREDGESVMTVNDLPKLSIDQDNYIQKIQLLPKL